MPSVPALFRVIQLLPADGFSPQQKDRIGVSVGIEHVGFNQCCNHFSGKRTLPLEITLDCRQAPGGECRQEQGANCGNEPAIRAQAARSVAAARPWLPGSLDAQGDNLRRKG
jgi:hypothetical protein